MTYNAAREAGFPAADAWKLAREVGAVDRRPGSQGADAEAANGHAMGGRIGGSMAGRKDGRQQTRSEAYEGTTDVVASNDLPAAIHAIQDSYYHGYGNWDGGGPHHWPGLEHFYRDLWYSNEAVAATTAYIKFGGNPMNFSGFQAPQ